MAQLTHAQRSKVRNREIGFIFQSFNLIGDLTVWGKCRIAADVSGADSFRAPGAGGRGVDEGRHDTAGKALSGAAFRRTAAACCRSESAWGGGPSILLADEPTGNLDSKNGDAVMALLRELHAEGATICLVTHDPRHARDAQKTIHLFDGQVVTEEEAAIKSV